LVKALRAESVLVGDNFCFGNQHAGTPQTLEELGARWHFRTEILPKMILRNRVVSSSQIRILLESGKIPLANRLLQHPFNIRGPIEPGLGIGSSRTVPTFNLGAYPGLLPGGGVYITVARIADREIATNKIADQLATLSRPLPSVTNVGRRPTFGERELGVETHLLDPWDGLPPTVLDVSFLYRLRDEHKFDSAEQLKKQIERDIARAQEYFMRRERARIPMAESV
jgi:riboflavin kinase/FMN adenylyltransferase